MKAAEKDDRFGFTKLDLTKGQSKTKKSKPFGQQSEIKRSAPRKAKPKDYWQRKNAEPTEK